MVGMADLMERQSPKLLAQAGQVLNQIVSEALCDEPQKKLMQALLESGAVFAAGVAVICQLTEPEAQIIPNAGCAKQADLVLPHWHPRLRNHDCARRSATAGAGVWSVWLGP